MLMSSSWKKIFLDKGKDDYIAQLFTINAAVLLSFRHYQLELMNMYPTRIELLTALAQVPRQHPEFLCRLEIFQVFIPNVVELQLHLQARSRISLLLFSMIFKHGLHCMKLGQEASFNFHMIMFSPRDSILAPPPSQLHST